MRCALWVPDPLGGADDVYYLLHWATLLEGARRAYAADTNRENSAVQFSVRQGIPRCKEYDSRTPPDVVAFLVEVANRVNENATAATLVEKWQRTVGSYIGFHVRRSATSVAIWHCHGAKRMSG